MTCRPPYLLSYARPLTPGVPFTYQILLPVIAFGPRRAAYLGEASGPKRRRTEAGEEAMTPRKASTPFARPGKLGCTQLPRASLTRSLFDAHVLAVCIVAAYVSAAGGHSNHVEAVPRRRLG